MSVLTTHDDLAEEDCWLALFGNIFDLSDYEHPGGNQLIAPHCGTDASVTYQSFHRRIQLDLIQTRKVGTLQQVAPSLAPSTIPRQATEPTLQPSPINKCHRSYTVDHIQTHDSINDCWYILYDGRVWDVTFYLDKHPGGKAVMLGACGTDAQTMYESIAAHTGLKMVVGEAGEFEVGIVGDRNEWVGDCENTNDYGETLTPTLTAPVLLPTFAPTAAASIPPLSSAPVVIVTAATTTQLPSKSSVLLESSVKKANPAMFSIGDSCFIPQYSPQELQKHNSGDDCWYYLYNKVWHMTPYLARHPGGVAVMLAACGGYMDQTTVMYESIVKHTGLAMVLQEAGELEIGLLGETNTAVAVDCVIDRKSVV